MNLMNGSGSGFVGTRVQRSFETGRCRARVDELREHAVRVGVQEAPVAQNPACNVT